MLLFTCLKLLSQCTTKIPLTNTSLPLRQKKMIELVPLKLNQRQPKYGFLFSAVSLYDTQLHRVDFYSGVLSVVSWYCSVHWHWHWHSKARFFLLAPITMILVLSDLIKTLGLSQQLFDVHKIN